MLRYSILVLCFCITLIQPDLGCFQEGTIYRFNDGCIELRDDEIRVREIFSLSGYLSTRKIIEIEYKGKVTPPNTYFYSKTRNGVKYEGTLKLEKYYYSHVTDKTTARYIGDAYPVE